MMSLNKKHAVKIAKMIKDLDLIIFESDERKMLIPSLQIVRSDLFQSLNRLGYELDLNYKIVSTKATK